MIRNPMTIRVRSPPPNYSAAGRGTVSLGWALIVIIPAATWGITHGSCLTFDRSERGAIRNDNE